MSSSATASTRGSAAHRSTTIPRIGSEAIRNRVARLGLTLVLAVAVAIAVGIVFVGEYNATVEARQYGDSLIRSGHSTLLVDRETDQDADTSGFPWITCQSLGGLPGVQVTVGFQHAGSASLWSPDGPPLSLLSTTSDVIEYLRFVAPTEITHWTDQQIILDGQAATAARGLSETRAFNLVVVGEDGRSDTVSAFVAPITSLGNGLAGAALMVDSSPERIARCALLVKPDERKKVQRAVAAVLPAAEGYTARWTLANADRFPAARASFEQRPARFYWMPAAAVFVSLWALTLRLHRADHAMYVVAGLNSIRLSVMVTFEALLVVGTGATLGGTYILASSHRTFTQGDAVHVALLSAARSLVAMTLGAIVLSVIAAHLTRRVAIDALKDR